jgi:hypothetical protein
MLFALPRRACSSPDPSAAVDDCRTLPRRRTGRAESGRGWRRRRDAPVRFSGCGRHCQVDDRGGAEGLWLTRTLRGDCKDGHVSPDAKRGVAGGAVGSGGKTVAAKLEVVVDAAMAGQKTLRLAR